MKGLKGIKRRGGRVRVVVVEDSGKARSRDAETIVMSRSSPPSSVRISRMRGDVDVRYDKAWREVSRGRVASR